MTPADTVSVVIASYRTTPGVLPDVVAGYLAQQPDEVVIVLDGPQPRSRAALGELSDPPGGTRLVVEELDANVGQSLAKLHGVRAATSRIVLASDDDILVRPGVVARQRRLHAGRDDRVVVGHLPVTCSGGAPAVYRLFSAEYTAVTRRWEREPETILEGMYGGLMSAPRTLFLAAHEYRPTEPLPYFEDLDLGIRLAAVGGIGVFDVETAGDHLYAKSIESFVVEARQRQRAAHHLQRRWGAVPRYTRTEDTLSERSARRAYARARRFPLVGQLSERAALTAVGLTGRVGWGRGEDLCARVLRGMVEAGMVEAGMVEAGTVEAGTVGGQP